MTVSGLIVTFAEGEDARAAVLARLGTDPRLTLGQPIADRLPIAAETHDLRAGEALVRELEATAGVARVDVVSLDFSSSMEDR